MSVFLEAGGMGNTPYLCQYGDREAWELWQRLQRCIPAMVHGVNIEPSLLHGDLWSGNVGEVGQQPGNTIWPSCSMSLSALHSGV